MSACTLVPVVAGLCLANMWKQVQHIGAVLGSGRQRGLDALKQDKKSVPPALSNHILVTCLL